MWKDQGSGRQDRETVDGRWSIDRDLQEKTRNIWREERKKEEKKQYIIQE